jgi:hypothetical protein
MTLMTQQYETVVCGTCFAMVPKREMHRHSQWHRDLEKKLKETGREKLYGRL